jgi:hypothetical protein
MPSEGWIRSGVSGFGGFDFVLFGLMSGADA